MTANRTTFKITGDEAMLSEIRKLARKYPALMRQEVRAEGEEVMSDSKRNYVPVDDGHLRNSGKVGHAKRVGEEIVVVLSYGDAASPYALAVHEHPSSASPPSWEGKPIEGIKSVRTRSSWSREGRGPKFLERPMKDAQRTFATRLAERLNVNRVGS